MSNSENSVSGNVARGVVIPPQGGVLRPWQPGQSGNPGGRSIGQISAYQEARQIAAKHTPEAVRIQVELMRNEDPRIQILATQAIIERGAGKVRDHSDEEKQRATVNLDALTSDDRRALALLLRKALGG